MSDMRLFLLSVFFLLGVSLLSSCTTMLFLLRQPLELRPAIHSLTDDLMRQLKLRLGITGKAAIVIGPFADAETNEAPKVSMEIEAIIIQRSGKVMGIDAGPMDFENLQKADYVMSGVIRPEPCQARGGTDKCYYVAASVFNSETAEIVAHSEVRIFSGQPLDYSYLSMPILRDSPVNIEDSGSAGGSVVTANRPVGAMADKAYFESLKMMSLLTDAETAYGNADYERSLFLLEKAAQREDGQLVKTYAGLYCAYRKLGRMDKAEDAFARLLALSVEKNKMLSVKFLFDVDSVKFWRDPELREQYVIWLRQIGKYFSSSPYCLRIIGHCSHTGSEGYNKGLSLARAHRIRELIIPYFSDVSTRCEAVGKGFSENIVGSGADDESDAIDRRVEFVVTDCGK